MKKLLLILILLLTSCIKNEDIIEVVIEEPIIETPVIEEVTEEIITTTQMSLLMVGDVLIHKRLSDEALFDGNYDYSYMFESIKPIIEEADYSIANLETQVGGVELGISGYPRFNAPFELADALKYTGFDFLTTANNHSLDKGEQGVINTLDYLDSINIMHTGTSRSVDEENQFSIVTINDITLGIISYTYGTNGLKEPSGKEYLVNNFNVDEIKEDIILLEPDVDLVILSLHYGTEYINYPRDHERIVYQELIEAGIDILLGHHPHVIQPAEYFERTDGSKGLIYYSLGNFISAHAKETLNKSTGGIAIIDIKKDLETDLIEIENASLIPIYTYRLETSIHLLKDIDEELLSNKDEHYLNIIDIIQSYDESILFEITY
jgi:poly-gamma-glutamate synthesis protein (capsule biosynthesis protein)